MRGIAVIISTLCMALCSPAESRRALDGGWEFRRVGGAEWRSASVPGVVHTDLMTHGLIPDPFVGENERMVQWVDKEDWEYRTTFTIDTLHKHTDLIFKGLDTYADVWVNDSLLLQADNMFRTWEVPVSGIVRQGENTLRVLFHSPIKTDIPKYDALPYHLEAGNDQSERGGVFDKKVSVFARKAGYHYGWDWGPRLVTSGIWRNVILRESDSPYIKDVYIRTLSIDKHEAEMLATVELCGWEASRLRIETEGVDIKKKIKPGQTIVEIPFTIKNPRLWWCNGLGDANLYDFTVSIGTDTKTVRTGIRTIELVRDDGAFCFKLNGLPVFAKGANYIPCDSFLPRVSDETYRQTVQDAADANMNMLRVWGGGVYEADRLYELCDSLGIMVWQDFMFACSLYPADSSFLKSVEAEAIDNIKRLRNHPSIALWCGNNECLEAWYCWGYKRKYEREGVADLIWGQYCDLFHDLLPIVTAQYAPDVAYHASSPMSREDGRPEPEKGDYHFWTVWGGDAPTEEYANFKSRFFSEYGFQSFPEISTIKRFTNDLYAESDEISAHQRCPVGNSKLFGYLEREMPEPKDFESMVYMSQLLQADAIRTAIEAHRRDAPHCMGSLFWQINDCWPVASWSSRDYYGRWKAQHYFARKAFADILLSIEEKGDSIRITEVGTRHGASTATIQTACREFTAALPAIFAKQPGDQFVAVSFNGEYENIRLLKGAELREPNISLEITPAEGGYDLTVSADTFVRALAFYLEDGNGKFSDNYIDLLPNRSATIRLLTTKTLEELKSHLTTQNLKSATKISPLCGYSSCPPNIHGLTPAPKIILPLTRLFEAAQSTRAYAHAYKNHAAIAAAWRLYFCRHGCQPV